MILHKIVIFCATDSYGAVKHRTSYNANIVFVVKFYYKQKSRNRKFGGSFPAYFMNKNYTRRFTDAKVPLWRG